MHETDLAYGWIRIGHVIRKRTKARTGAAVSACPAIKAYCRRPVMPDVLATATSNHPFVGASHRLWNPAATSVGMIDRRAQAIRDLWLRSAPPKPPSASCL